MAEGAPKKPLWQTDDLEEEWIEQDEEEQASDEEGGATSSNMDETEPYPGSSVGTFLVRDDVAQSPILPQTPGRKKKNVFMKDFFSPLALERMFEPPSPPPSTPSPPLIRSLPPPWV